MDLIIFIWKSSPEDLHCHMAWKRREQGQFAAGTEKSRRCKHASGIWQIRGRYMCQCRDRRQHHGRCRTVLSDAVTISLFERCVGRGFSVLSASRHVANGFPMMRRCLTCVQVSMSKHRFGPDEGLLFVRVIATQ